MPDDLVYQNGAACIFQFVKYVFSNTVKNIENDAARESLCG